MPREQIFITTKVRPQLIGDGPLQRSVEESLKRLRLDAVDLLLIHWPNPDVPIAESMRALSAAKRAGMTRAIGVSNFIIAKLEEVDPGLARTDRLRRSSSIIRISTRLGLLAAVRRHGLAITAYCPIALGRVASDPRARRDRPEARQERRPGDAPLARPAGRRDRHPENVEARAA